MKEFGFKFNNKVSDNEDIRVISLPPITQSTERVNEYTIDGKDGHLTELNGYEGETKPVIADYFGKTPSKLYNWLKGDGEVIFGDQADRYYKARISNKIPFEEYIKNQIYTFPIEFRCQPFGYLLEGKEVKTLTSGTTLNNNKATHISKPIITIYGTGACSVTINGRTFNITSITGGSITIDSDIEEVYNGKGRQMTGKFPYLDVGENVISFTGSGVSKIEVTANWRAI
jgi:phage-related protein